MYGALVTSGASVNCPPGCTADAFANAANGCITLFHTRPPCFCWTLFPRNVGARALRYELWVTADPLFGDITQALFARTTAACRAYHSPGFPTACGGSPFSLCRHRTAAYTTV